MEMHEILELERENNEQKLKYELSKAKHENAMKTRAFCVGLITQQLTLDAFVIRHTRK